MKKTNKTVGTWAVLLLAMNGVFCTLLSLFDFGKEYYAEMFFLYVFLIPLMLFSKNKPESIEKSDNVRAIVYFITGNVFGFASFAAENGRVPKYKISVPAVSIGLFIFLFYITDLIGVNWIIQLLFIGLFTTIPTVKLIKKNSYSYDEYFQLRKDQKDQLKQKKEQQENPATIPQQPDPKEGY